MASYCSGCGAALSADARFCSACGRPVVDPGFVPPPPPPRALLVRPRIGRKIAGVCRGLANQYGWDVTVVRVIAVLLAIVTFPIGLVAYVLFWVIVPEEAPAAPTSLTNLPTSI